MCAVRLFKVLLSEPCWINCIAIDTLADEFEKDLNQRTHIRKRDH